MKMTQEDILKYAVNGARKELKSAKRIFGVDHKSYKHAKQVYNKLYKLLIQEQEARN